jgi:hypothetical protein
MSNKPNKSEYFSKEDTDEINKIILGIAKIADGSRGDIFAEALCFHLSLLMRSSAEDLKAEDISAFLNSMANSVLNNLPDIDEAYDTIMSHAEGSIH